MNNAQNMALAGLQAAVPDQRGNYAQGTLMDMLWGPNRPPLGPEGPAGRDWIAEEINRKSFALMRYVPFELTL